jgi:transposase
MLPLLQRHAVQVLLAAGHTLAQVAEHTRASVRTIRRIAKEEAVNHVDDVAERERRKIGRPSRAEAVRLLVCRILADDAELPTQEILRRVTLEGYAGKKSALYALVARLRPRRTKLEMRFEGLVGEFSQHDFGQLVVSYLDGRKERIHFFCSRLKWSRMVQVTIVADETAETLTRTVLDHFVAFGGVPLCAVFDRPKTVAISWNSDGTVTEWNSTFALAATEIGFVPEVCWAYAPNQKGAVEQLVKWVKGAAFFKVRKFQDREDLLRQLEQWHVEVNEKTPSRATEIIPAVRHAQEKKRLRPPRVTPDAFALRIPIQVGPTGFVVHHTNPYSMPPDACGLTGTLYLYRNRVRIVAGRFSSEHARLLERNAVSSLAEHRASALALITGKRGRNYLKRQHVFEVGPASEPFLTELVHRNPRGWYTDIDRLHTLLQKHGADTLHRALRAAIDVDRIDVAYVERCLVGALAPRPSTLFPEAHA